MVLSWLDGIAVTGILILATTFAFGWWEQELPFKESDPPHWVLLVWCGLALLIFAITTAVALWTSTTVR